MLKPGGKMLYSTCTFSKKENEETIAYLLEQCEDMEVLAPLGYGVFWKKFSFEGKSEEMCSQLKIKANFPHKMGRGRTFSGSVTEKRKRRKKSVPEKNSGCKKG